MDRKRDSFLYANSNTNETGVRGIVWISQRGPHEASLVPRIEVYPNGRRGGHFHVSIAADPVVIKKTRRPVPSDADIARAIRFVQLNHRLLARYWADLDMCTSELCNGILAVTDPPPEG